MGLCSLSDGSPGTSGVSTKTIRVYHDKGLLPEPDRDASGYRRYTVQDAVELIRVRTLAEAGVPLARIRDLKVASAEAFRPALTQIDEGLAARIRSLQATQLRLRELASGHTRLLPTAVDHHLQRLVGLGFTERWVAMERDLWILVFATHPQIASQRFDDQAQTRPCACGHSLTSRLLDRAAHQRRIGTSTCERWPGVQRRSLVGSRTYIPDRLETLRDLRRREGPYMRKGSRPGPRRTFAVDGITRIERVMTTTPGPYRGPCARSWPTWAPGRSSSVHFPLDQTTGGRSVLCRPSRTPPRAGRIESPQLGQIRR